VVVDGEEIKNKNGKKGKKRIEAISISVKN
jgi:hypothetical protein